MGIRINYCLVVKLKIKQWMKGFLGKRNA